ncbi:Transcription factor jun-B-like protein [Hapsidospora chrysogenum ATCC 11550]|uniref:Transcription factor jun-B-like protein n=1 Tax=Hapsidospora chrysogenum (strain ATCC 11550 / CBS 779.69 / DSM 880 / IAM 14645 / JCM 23072 / IMI 49137) TaxID=857340 RepID=A0A086ST49_HAPC1|nr:Transcription factor jun-B-like protein [Hapsidospora chrysogenum ATCC 11550]
MVVGIFPPDLEVFPGQLPLHPALGSPSGNEGDLSEAQATTMISPQQDDFFTFPPPAPMEPVPCFFNDAMLFPDNLPFPPGSGGPPSDQPNPPSQTGPENTPSPNSPVTEGQDPAKESGITVRRSTRRATQRARPSNLEQSSSPAEESMPRTGGRKRKQEHGDAEHAGGEQEELYGSDVQRTRRSRQNLERNRIAATRCRERKREQATVLEDAYERFKWENGQLSAECAGLRRMAYDLKTEIFKHAHCGDEMIDDFIGNVARETANAAVASRRNSQDDTTSLRIGRRSETRAISIAAGLTGNESPHPSGTRNISVAAALIGNEQPPRPWTRTMSIAPGLTGNERPHPSWARSRAIFIDADLARIEKPPKRHVWSGVYGISPGREHEYGRFWLSGTDADDDSQSSI